jgi:hypothetical protein
MVQQNTVVSLLGNEEIISVRRCGGSEVLSGEDCNKWKLKR